LATDISRDATRVIADARNTGLRDLSADTLQTMRDEAAQVREDISRQVAEEGERFAAARQAGEWQLTEECRERIFGLQEDLSSVQEEWQRLSSAYQSAHLHEGVVGALGSEGRATLLEGAILVLIAAVLGILWIETSYTLTPAEEHLLAIADTAICAIFLTEFFWRMRFADSKRWYWRRYWVDFVASLPLAGVLRIGRIARLARAARIARVARAARLLRALRALAFLSRGFDKIAAVFRLQVFVKPLLLTLALLVIGGIAISQMEGGESPDVHGFWQGIWWSFTTVITGGFGDIHNPVSSLGRILTVLLVLLGIVLTGALTAGLASILMGDDTIRIERNQSTMQAQLSETTDRLARLEELLAAKPAGED